MLDYHCMWDGLGFGWVGQGSDAGLRYIIRVGCGNPSRAVVFFQICSSYQASLISNCYGQLLEHLFFAKVERCGNVASDVL